MRELAPDRRADLRYRLGRTQPVEPRHQRGVQAGGDGERRRRNRRDARAAAPSPSASSTAFVISSTNNGMPSARSTMSCRMLVGSGLFAGDLLDQGHHLAGSKPIDRQRRHMRTPDPWRGEFRPEGHEQQHPQASILSTSRPNTSRLEGSAQWASSKIISTGVWREIASIWPINASIVFCRRCCGASSSAG